MTAPVLAEVYAGDARTTVHLGGALVASPRLALRWLRGQAERLANGLDPDPGAPWIPRAALRAVPPAERDAPAELRAWAADDKCRGEALDRIASGGEFEFVVRDGACWYRLTARPLLIPDFTRKADALINVQSLIAPPGCPMS
ncbi:MULTISPECIES: hypothetical protein [unclassified Streptomyces]|uniref:hypothetical protein n=1 Tax=unclassified Streptomyces TaxID=2593676 RepID=UPI000963F899|nr:hypothetical protein [Streptomyces sp. CB01580]OKJ43591.1 hypothetical protein AMK22_02855 [Streptomyces sp. CB01580]